MRAGIVHICVAAAVLLLSSCSNHLVTEVRVDCPVLPVLVHKEASPVIKMTAVSRDTVPPSIGRVVLDLGGCTDFSDILLVGAYGLDKKGNPDPGKKLCREVEVTSPVVCLEGFDTVAAKDSVSFWVAVTLRDTVDLDHRILLRCRNIDFFSNSGFCRKGRLTVQPGGYTPLRVGVAVRQKGQDGVVSSRIPGLATACDGTLLAVFDARRDRARDLQGDIDIALHRSMDKGMTWQPLQTVLDMGEWGRLPQKYNGVSDACILVDRNTSEIFVAGLWMHGVLDSDGRWVEGLSEVSTEWMHQWNGKGSQPGLGVKQTSQFLIARSNDGGLSWSAPENITASVKKEEWWLYAPAPGQGITMDDGTLVFPSQGRDSDGVPFSCITWSKDHGRTWHVSSPAYSDVTECSVAELPDHSLMLNMRDNRNKGCEYPNGRRVFTTSDFGETWTEHPSSHRALVEPTCMASLHRHVYTADGCSRNILLFSNPDNWKSRDRITLKASLDGGMTWPDEYRILIDEYRSAGYSCITSVDENTIGILYESSQSDLAFVRIGLDEILKTR